jgi:hypothetical protein
MDSKHWLPTLHPSARIDLTNWLWRSDIQKGAAVSLRSGRSCFSFLLNPILKRRWDQGWAGYQAGAKRQSGLMAGLITDVSSLTEMMLSRMYNLSVPTFWTCNLYCGWLFGLGFSNNLYVSPKDNLSALTKNP